MSDSNVFDQLKSQSKNLSAIPLKSLDSRLSVFSFADSGKNKVQFYYDDETIVIRGKMRSVRRVYAIRGAVDSDDKKNGVGWIIDEDITECMVCALPFGLFRYKHHCRSCGNLVCNTCSSERALIYEMIDLGPLRVCIQCYWGQEVVYASHWRDFSSDDEDDNLSVSDDGKPNSAATNAASTSATTQPSKISHEHSVRFIRVSENGGIISAVPRFVVVALSDNGELVFVNVSVTSRVPLLVSQSQDSAALNDEFVIFIVRDEGSKGTKYFMDGSMDGNQTLEYLGVDLSQNPDEFINEKYQEAQKKGKEFIATLQDANADMDHIHDFKVYNVLLHPYALPFAVDTVDKPFAFHVDNSHEDHHIVCANETLVLYHFPLICSIFVFIVIFSLALLYSVGLNFYLASIDQN